MGLAAECAGSGTRIWASSFSSGFAAKEKKASGSLPKTTCRSAAIASSDGGEKEPGIGEKMGSAMPGAAATM